MSEATARRWTEAAGVASEGVQTAQAEQIRRDLPPALPGAERVLVSADGACVPVVQGEWAQVQLLVIGAIHPDAAGQPQTQHLASFARLAEAEAFSQAALVERERRGLERAGAVCAVLEGAEWRA